MSNKQKVIFLHIPKAGGSTLRSVLKRLYSKKEIFLIRSLKKNKYTNAFIQLPAAEKENISLLMGHMEYGLHEHFPNSKYISMVRNPVNRAISNYYFVLQSPYHPLNKKLVKENISLFDYIDQDINRQLDNGMTRDLSGVGWKVDKCTPEMLALAKENIQNNFLLVGTMERFDESLLLLKKYLNWEEYPCYVRMNTNKKNREEPSKEVIELLKEKNQFDLDLYHWVTAELDKKVSEHQAYLEEAAAEFKTQNKAFDQASTFQKTIQAYKNQVKRPLQRIARLIIPISKD